jgi:7-cyano-7-deazaguanine reductase
MGSISDSPLGKSTHYPDAYDAALLYPVERAPQRLALGILDAPPFSGVDRWTAWELMWLDAQGRPQAAIARFDVPCTSPRIVESKSVKLYLTSLNHARFASPERLRETLAGDLSRATGAEVDVRIDLPAAWPRHARIDAGGVVIDEAMPAVLSSAPDAALLRTSGGAVDELLVSHTFRSVCPVTGQPDYACVHIDYRGPAIDRASLSAYLAGYRQHPGFHEHCVERIYMDVLASCRPAMLAVEARFTRRGGVDINPWRASEPAVSPLQGPTFRQ